MNCPLGSYPKGQFLEFNRIRYLPTGKGQRIFTFSVLFSLKALHLWTQMQKDELTASRHELKPDSFMIWKLPSPWIELPCFFMPKAIHAPQVQFMALANSCPQGQFIALCPLGHKALSVLLLPYVWVHLPPRCWVKLFVWREEQAPPLRPWNNVIFTPWCWVKLFVKRVVEGSEAARGQWMTSRCDVRTRVWPNRSRPDPYRY